jgi:hypothetical protein
MDNKTLGMNSEAVSLQRKIFAVLASLAAGVTTMSLIPLPAFASEPTMLTTVLEGLGTVAGVLGGIAMVILLTKAIFEFAMGKGSIGTIVKNLLILIAFIALIVVATNISTIQASFGGVANQSVNIVADTANSALGS